VMMALLVLESLLVYSRGRPTVLARR